MQYDTGPAGLGQAVNLGSIYTGLYVDVSEYSHPGGGPLTLATWFKTADNFHSLPAIHGRGDLSQDLAAVEIIEGRPSVSVFDSDAALQENRLTHPVELADGQWHHLAMTFSASESGSPRLDDTLKLFVDGKPSATSTQALGPLDISGWHVGREYGAARYYSGSLDDVRMYARALGDGEIAQLYALGVPEPSSIALLAASPLAFLLARVIRRRAS